MSCLFLKRYPIPIAGLILALFALGNLLQSYDPRIRLALGGIAAVLYVIYLLKLVVLNTKLKEPLENPVAASVLPTFTMATMLLGGYVKPYAPSIGVALWYAGLIGHALLILWFSWGFLRGFSIKKVFPSWFIVYVGIAVASVSAPVAGRLDIGQAAFWFALAAYLCLLPFVCWRAWVVRQIPDPAKPTAVIFAAPASLLLAGYMTSFEVKAPNMVYALLMASLLFFLVGMFYLIWLTWKQPDFTPAHAAFTFPIVISTIAVKLVGPFLGRELEIYQLLVTLQTILAALVVLWVLVRYLFFLFVESE